MAARNQPLAVTDRTAAAMLDMPCAKFRRLVSQGALPRGKMIGDEMRWSYAQLSAVVDGTAAHGGDDQDISV